MLGTVLGDLKEIDGLFSVALTPSFNRTRYGMPPPD